MDPRQKIRSIISRPPGVSGKLDEVPTAALIECAFDVDERLWRRLPVTIELGRRLSVDERAPLDRLLHNVDEDRSLRLTALSSMCAILRDTDSAAKRASSSGCARKYQTSGHTDPTIECWPRAQRSVT